MRIRANEAGIKAKAWSVGIEVPVFAAKAQRIDAEQPSIGAKGVSICADGFLSGGDAGSIQPDAFVILPGDQYIPAKEQLAMPDGSGLHAERWYTQAVVPRIRSEVPVGCACEQAIQAHDPVPGVSDRSDHVEEHLVRARVPSLPCGKGPRWAHPAAGDAVVAGLRCYTILPGPSAGAWGGPARPFLAGTLEPYVQ